MIEHCAPSIVGENEIVEQYCHSSCSYPGIPGYGEQFTSKFHVSITVWYWIKHFGRKYIKKTTWFFFFRNLPFDIRTPSKHQHVLNPMSLVTGLTHHIVGKVRDHVHTYTKPPPTLVDKIELTENVETTTKEIIPTEKISKRQTLFDIMANVRNKRSIQSDKVDSNTKEDCGCGGKLSIADGIAEHVVDKINEKSVELKTDYDSETSELALHKKRSVSIKTKRSSDNNGSKSTKSQSDMFEYFVSALGGGNGSKSSPKRTTSTPCTKDSGTCDRN